MSENTHKSQQDKNGMRGPMGRMPIESKKDFKGYNIKACKIYRKISLFSFAVIILSIGSTVFNILGPKKLGKAVNEIFYGLQNKIKVLVV